MSTSESTDVAVLAINPAIDICYEVAQIVADLKVRAETTRYSPGGNGINVARALVEFDTPFRCCSVVGGESGDLFLQLLGDRLGGHHNVFRVPGATRVNVIVVQKSPPAQYEVDSVGPEIPSDVLDELTRCFLSACGNGYGILSGSVPPGVPGDHWRKMAEQIRAQGGRAVVDAYGPMLKEALQARPWLVRLNRYVVEMATMRRLESIEAVATAAREMQAGGVEIVCVSLGADGAVLVDATNSYHCAARRVHVQSTVGSGDAMVAGLVTAARRGGDPRAMLRLGVACGSATATHPGTELFTRDEVERLLDGLEVRSLDL